MSRYHVGGRYNQSPASRVTFNPLTVSLELLGVNLPREFEDLTGRLQRPGDERPRDSLNLKLSHDNKVSVTFVPQVAGNHMVYIYKSAQGVTGSPFTVRVEEPLPLDPSKVKVFGDGHKRGTSGQLNKFVVDARDAGNGSIGFSIKGPSKPELNSFTKDDGTCEVNFLPKSSGTYTIHVKYAEMDIPGSPFTCAVTEVEGQVSDKGDESLVTTVASNPFTLALELPALNLPSDFIYLTGKLQRPGEVRPKDSLKLKLSPDNTVSLTFVPLVAGDHLAYIYKNGMDISGSPFTIRAEKPPSPDPRKVKVIGDGHKRGHAGQLSKFTVDASDAGNGILGFSINGPSKAELNSLSNEDGTCDVSFVPETPGIYTIQIIFADQHIPGSPFDCAVAAIVNSVPDKGEETPPIKSNPLTCALELVGVYLPWDFKYLTGKLQRPGDDRPKDSLELQISPDNVVSVTFVPLVAGDHLAHIYKNGEVVTGSPFTVRAEGPIPPDPRKVKISGEGYKRGTAGQMSKFTVDTRDAGNSDLGFSIKGPSKTQLSCLSKEDGTCEVNFVPKLPGMYTIHIKFADHHIPGSPFTCTIVGDGSTPVKEDDGPNTAPTCKPFTLVLQMSGISLPSDFGLLTGKLQRPGDDRPKDSLKLQLSPDNTVSLTFVPLVAGDHFAYIYKNGKEVSGSPFPVLAEEPIPPDSTKVKVIGDGYKRGTAGQMNKFTVDARDAGEGGLGFFMEGPSKAQLNCMSKEDGTCEVNFVPKNPGVYKIHIKFADQHIPGSPFACSVRDVDGTMPNMGDISPSLLAMLEFP